MFIFTISDIIGIAAFAVAVIIIIGLFIAGGIVKLRKKFSKKVCDMRSEKE